MESPRIYTDRAFYRRGFTLLEVMVVIGIFTILASITAFIDLGNLRGDSFRSEQKILVVALQTARADALNNINEEKHGVAFHPAGYPHSSVLFQGGSYATRDVGLDQEIKESYEIDFGAGTPSEVVFSQLSGDSNFSGTITFVDPKRNGFTLVTTINNEGQINW